MGGPTQIRCGACGALNRIPPDKSHLTARCGRCRTALHASPAQPLAVTDASFEADVLQAPMPVLVDCWAPWCGPCRMLAPVIDALAQSYAGRVRVAKLNVDDNPAVAGRYAVQGIPTLLLFEGGHLRDRVVGLQPRAALEARLDSLLARPAG